MGGGCSNGCGEAACARGPTKCSLRDNPNVIVLGLPATLSILEAQAERQETAMLHFTSHDLVFLIPMALVGMIAFGGIPFTARALRISCRAAGAIFGALLAVALLEALPLLI